MATCSSFDACAATDLEDIVASGLCAGCGLCESIAGSSVVSMAMSPEGRVRPVVKDASTFASSRAMDQIRLCCPGKTLEGPGTDELADVHGAGASQAFLPFMHPVFGPLRAWFRGYAGDPAVRFRAAAGGSLTALASFLLETGQVELVLHVRASEQDPSRTEAHISADPASVFSGCQSRYGPAAPLVHVKQLLDEGRTFALVAKPCDVSAVRSYGKRVDARVEAQIPFMLSIFCGGLPSRNTALKIARHHGVAEPVEENIDLLRFRGEGWPGLMTVRRKADGKEFGTDYNNTWRWNFNPLGKDAGIAYYDIQWRCKCCPDAIGEQADVSCPDGWLWDDEKICYNSKEHGLQLPVGTGKDAGQNLVLCRTRRGNELVRAAVAAGKLVTTPLEISELEHMHDDHYPRKCSWPLRLFAMWTTRQRAVLTVTNYRWKSVLWTQVVKMGPWSLWNVFRGTWERCASGRNLELCQTDHSEPVLHRRDTYGIPAALAFVISTVTGWIVNRGQVEK